MIARRAYYYTPTCDGCGTELDAEYSCIDAANAMKRGKWSFVRPDAVSGEWINFCPACKERRAKRNEKF